MERRQSMANVPGAIARLARSANGGVVIPGELPAKEAAAVLMVAQLPLTGVYDPLTHKRTKSHVKPSSAARRAAKIAAGKLKVVDGQLIRMPDTAQMVLV